MSDGLRGTLRAAGKRFTVQRQLILQVLEQSQEHLDAETLHERVQVHDSSISLATVYRTLNTFKEMGLVEEHLLGEGHSHYEIVRDRPHYHFTCQRCGKVIEFDTPLVAQIERELSERKGVQVTGMYLYVQGICAQCRRENK